MSLLLWFLFLLQAAASQSPAPSVRQHTEVHWVHDTVVVASTEAIWVWSTEPGVRPLRLPPSPVLAVSPDGMWIATDRLLYRVGLEAPVMAWPRASAVGFDESSRRITTQTTETGEATRVVRRLPDPLLL